MGEFLLNQISTLPLGFGGASLSGEGGGYGFGSIDDNQAQDLIRGVIDLGITVFDTAPIYGFGLGEIRLGKGLKEKRDDVFLISKCGIDWHSTKRVNLNNQPKVCLRMLGESLKRLQTDYLDLYMIHWPDPRVDIRYPFEVLLREQEKGKIKHLGLCNTNIEDLAKVEELGRVEFIQSEFNLFTEDLDPVFLSYLKMKKISFMNWGSLDKGIISGTVRPDRQYDQSDARSWAPWWKKRDNKKRIEVMDQVFKLVGMEEHSGLELALGFNLSHDFLQLALCGGRTVEQWQQLIKAIDHSPNEETIKKARKITLGIHE